MIMYQLVKDWNNVITRIRRLSDGALIPFDPDNIDYQAYLKWLEESPDNVPLPAENE